MKTKSRAEMLARKRRLWEQRIQKWQDSGTSQSEYCRNNDLKVHQFTYWKKRLLPPDLPVSFVELQIAPSETRKISKKPIRLIINEHFHIEIERDFDSVALRQLVVALRQL